MMVVTISMSTFLGNFTTESDGHCTSDYKWCCICVVLKLCNVKVSVQLLVVLNSSSVDIDIFQLSQMVIKNAFHNHELFMMSKEYHKYQKLDS